MSRPDEWGDYLDPSVPWSPGQFHLGLWFNSPADATKAGCLSAVTPFNGDHTAGVQALSTKNFAAGNGPLARVTP